MPTKDPEKRKEQQRERSRRYRERHADEIRERTRVANAKARAADPERFAEYQRRFREEHPGYHARYELARYYKQREKVFNAIGWVCVGCGHDDPRVLEADHKDDDAPADRKRLGGYRGLLEHYAKNPDEAREKLQPLCRNCNWLKRKGCPLPSQA